MNETDLQRELMMTVERTVRALAARGLFKLRLRRELLDHLEQTLNEELAHAPPEEALARTLVRFGTPDEMRAALQPTIPMLERNVAWVDRVFFARHENDTDLKYALRLAWRGGFIYALFIAFSLGLLAVLQGKPIGQLIPGFFALKCAAFGLNLWLITWLASTATRPFIELPDDATRNARRLILASLAASLVLAATFVSLMAWSNPDPFLLARIAAGGFAGGAVLFPVSCWLYIREKTQLYPWESLEIE